MKYTYPIVSTHGIKCIGATNKNHLIVSWNKYFNKIVAFILKRGTITLTLDVPFTYIAGLSPHKDSSLAGTCSCTYFMLAFHSTVFSILLP